MTNIVITAPPAPRAPAPAPAPAPGAPAPAPAPASPPAPGVHYRVTGTASNPIPHHVASGGNTNIASANVAAIIHANFASVASHLSSLMVYLGGRPTRTKFWAQDQ